MTSSWSSSIPAAKKKQRSLLQGSTYKQAKSCGNLRNTSSATGRNIVCPCGNWGAHLCREEGGLCLSKPFNLRWVCLAFKLRTQELSHFSCPWRYLFLGGGWLLSLYVLLCSWGWFPCMKMWVGFMWFKCRHLHVGQSSLAPLLVKADLPDIVSRFRLNSFSLKKMSQKYQMSVCRMQLRLAVRGPKGDEF